MGREIRKVPPNYEHPKDFRRDGEYDYRPLYDGTFADAAAEWKSDFAKWDAGERESYFPPDKYPADYQYWEWNVGPPSRNDYREYEDAEATWLCVYETVSEGTPVTPPFATAAELVDYLVANGDFWDQRRGQGGWPRHVAERFVGEGWAPSAVVVGGTVYEPRDGQP